MQRDWCFLFVAVGGREGEGSNWREGGGVSFSRLVCVVVLVDLPVLLYEHILPVEYHFIFSKQNKIKSSS